ncbi:Uncharacterised protein [Halioglobus japonicus]|nr:Uncharacterised protein [Halioglobus japonicus]
MIGLKLLTGALALAASYTTVAAIPATPVMTLYQFNGKLEMPYYDVQRFQRSGPGSPAGTLAQGTTLIPCLVVENGRPLTDASGTPYVGFEIITDPRTATPAATARVTQAIAERKALTVNNHHCEPGQQFVISVRKLYAMEKVPFFDPPPSTDVSLELERGQNLIGVGTPDTLVRAFHNSAQCAHANDNLTARRASLLAAWRDFEQTNPGDWHRDELIRARHLDLTMRTALFEGHLERGCNAYGACERNIIALTIRNRALERCFDREGCTAEGDFSGVATKVTQYNIWDEYLTQISGLTSCFLRDDLATLPYYAKLQAMYSQNVGDVERILFGDDADLTALFPGTPLPDLDRTAHYYHAPAMGKCFPEHPRVEYMSGAIARNGDNFALIANTRIQAGDKVGSDYRFRSFVLNEEYERDTIEYRDDYPGFLVDGRKVSLSGSTGCAPYGIPAGCQADDVGRYRKTPFWLEAGKPLGLTCSIAQRGASCDSPAETVTVQVGGMCDTQMRPVSAVH